MKKTKLLLLVLALCLSVTACGSGNAQAGSVSNDLPIPAQSQSKPATSKSTSLELGTAYEFPDYADITLVRIETTSKIQGSMGGGMYYENSNAGETYVDVVFDLTNTSTNAISCDEFMTATAINGSKVTYDCKFYGVETDNMTSVSQFEEISPLSSVRFHAAFSVPENEPHLTLKFTINGSLFSYDYTPNVDVKNTTELNIGDILGDESVATAEFVNCEFTDLVEPSNTSRAYTYYKVDNSNNTYLVLTFNITNYSGQEKDADSFISAKATFMEKYKYNCFIVSEDDDAAGLSSYNKIAPLATAKVMCLIEVPKTVSDKDFSVDVMFNQESYTYVG